jgi:predicted DNA-binding transcriptional regulator AlpA
MRGVTVKEVSQRLGITEAALRKRVERGTFPKPDMRYGWELVWNEKTIDEWQKEQQ